MIIIDYSPTPEEVLNKDFLHHYQTLQPFGNGNREPIFLFDKPQFIKTHTVKNHLTFELKTNNQVFRGIGFNMAEKIQLIHHGPVQLAFKLKNTVYRGEQGTELHIVELIAAL